MPFISHIPVSPENLLKLEEELNALKHKSLASLGADDATYIKNILKTVRYFELAGRVLLWVSAFMPSLGVVLWLAAPGVLLLALSKIIDNMELGHNVMHGQYDWMNDPRFNGKSFEWDIAGTSENWRYTHNFRHHTYTNIHELDDDLGYGVLRIFPEQPWSVWRLGQPIYAVIFALLFQWGVAIQALHLGRWFKGRTPYSKMKKQLKPALAKMGRQLVKDYLIFPLLAGPGFLTVLLGNLAANGLRNVWTYVIIFCGHFTENVDTYHKKVLRQESKGAWYYRQIKGSSNLKGGFLFNVLTGHLSFQIEHHLFPDLPANRYPIIAPEIKAICAKYNISYNTGSFSKQFGSVVWRIIRHSFPSKPRSNSQ